jgi:hypothetical protein
MVPPRLVAFLAFGLLIFTSGCSNGRIPTFPVTGQVLFPDGSPVRVGTIELKSREHRVQARGEIGNDGRFVLTTFEHGDGAVAGHHDCVIVQFVMVENVAGFRPSTEGVIHPRYGSYATSGQVCEVSESSPNELTIHVEPWDKHSASRSATHDHQHHESSDAGGASSLKP